MTKENAIKRLKDIDALLFALRSVPGSDNNPEIVNRIEIYNNEKEMLENIIETNKE